MVRYSTIFVSRIHFNKRTSSEVEVIQRTLVAAKDLEIFSLKRVRKDGRDCHGLITTDHSQEIVRDLLMGTSLDIVENIWFAEAGAVMQHGS